MHVLEVIVLLCFEDQLSLVLEDINTCKNTASLADTQLQGQCYAASAGVLLGKQSRTRFQPCRYYQSIVQTLFPKRQAQVHMRP